MGEGEHTAQNQVFKRGSHDWDAVAIMQCGSVRASSRKKIHSEKNKHRGAAGDATNVQ